MHALVEKELLTFQDHMISPSFFVDSYYSMFSYRCFAGHFLSFDFLFNLEADFFHKDRKLVPTFNSSFRYIDDVLSLNNFWFDDYLYLIYPINELEVKNTTDNQKPSSCLDLDL